MLGQMIFHRDAGEQLQAAAETGVVAALLLVAAICAAVGVGLWDVHRRRRRLDRQPEHAPGPRPGTAPRGQARQPRKSELP